MTRITRSRNRTARLAAAALVTACAADLSFAQGGRGRFIDLDAAGTLRTISTQAPWRKTWHEVVPIKLGGSVHTDLLFYDRTRGDAKFFETDGAGNLKRIRHHSGWRKTWDRIIPGHFSGPIGSPTDLLFYDASNGLARFYRVNPGGTITFLKQHGWQHWDMIVPGHFGGLPYTDLLFYSRVRGEAKIYRTDGAGGIVFLAKFRFQKTWDAIVPGQFGGGATTDLFFYRKVIGDARFYSTDANGKLRLLKAYSGLRPTWDVVVPGLFDGRLDHTDLFFYDRNAGLCRVALVSNGRMTLRPLRSTDRTWGLIVPGLFDRKNGMDVLCYDRTLRLRIHAVRCMNLDGSKAAAIRPSQITEWVDRANEAWSSAGIAFDFDWRTDYEVIRNDKLNRLDSCKHFSSEAECNSVKALARAIAARRPCKITVFFRHGNRVGATGGGFSNPNDNYVAMPGFDKTKTILHYRNPNHPKHGKKVQGIKLLAHELGHYLGIAHPFVGVDYDGYKDPHAAVLSYMRKKGYKTMTQMDADRHVARDTPPDVGLKYFLLKGWNPADILQEIRISSPSEGIDFTTNPDRHNVMSYMGICNDYLRVSREQARTVRDWLHRPHRVKLLDRCSIPGLVTSFGTSCRLGQVHYARGNPGLGKALAYGVRGAPAGTAVSLVIGVSKTSWGPLRLPLSLDFIGMKGCFAYTDQRLVKSRTTNLAGTATFWVSIPDDPKLFDAVFYSQYVVVDPAANAAGLTTTNGLRTRVGG